MSNDDEDIGIHVCVNVCMYLVVLKFCNIQFHSFPIFCKDTFDQGKISTCLETSEGWSLMEISSN